MEAKCLSLERKIKLKKVFKSIYNQLFWVKVILVGIHSYIKFSIVVLINLKYQKDSVSIALGLLFLFSVPLLMWINIYVMKPELQILHMSRNSQDMETSVKLEAIRKRLGQYKPLFEGFKKDSFLALSYYPLYCIRRLIYIAIVIFIENSSIQLILKTINTMLSAVYILKVKPH